MDISFKILCTIFISLLISFKMELALICMHNTKTNLSEFDHLGSIQKLFKFICSILEVILLSYAIIAIWRFC